MDNLYAAFDGDISFVFAANNETEIIRPEGTYKEKPDQSDIVVSSDDTVPVIDNSIIPPIQESNHKPSFPQLLNEYKPQPSQFTSFPPVSNAERLSVQRIHSIVKGYQDEEERKLSDDDCNRLNNYNRFCDSHMRKPIINSDLFSELVSDNPFLDALSKYDNVERIDYVIKRNPDDYSIEDLEDLYTSCDNPPTKESLDIRHKLPEYFLRVPYKQDVGVSKYPIDDYMSWYKHNRLHMWAESRSNCGTYGYGTSVKQSLSVPILKKTKQLYLIVGYCATAYMFIAKTYDDELYLLHDDYAQKLDMPFNYYVNNMSVYYDLVRDEITPYFEHLNYIKYRLLGLECDDMNIHRRRAFEAEYEAITRFKSTMEELYPYLSDDAVDSFISSDCLASRIEVELDGNLLRLNDKCALCLDPFTGMLIPLELKRNSLWMGFQETTGMFYSLDKFIASNFVKMGKQVMFMRDALFKTPFAHSWNERIVIDSKLGLFSTEEIEGWKKYRIKSDATSSILYKMRLLEDMYRHGIITHWSDDVFKKNDYNPI